MSHTAEVELRVRAGSFGELAAEAGRALGALELGTVPPVPRGAWRTLTITAPDRDALLVDWLNELIYLAETERWVGVRFQPQAVTDTNLSMRVRGVVVAEAPARVKAATFHGLRVTPTAGGWAADVVFDV